VKRPPPERDRGDGLPERFLPMVPEGDTHPRLVCDHCGHIDYQNPRVVVGSVCTWEDRILLCRRAIDPRKGYWTLPAGYLERHESVETGARREAWEEAFAELDIDQVLAVYTIDHISQVQVIFRARLRHPNVRPGPESAEVALYRWDEIPWGEVAFPSVRWALEQFREVRDARFFPPFGNPEGARGELA
jgi:ADP-ribose pyrophosphatase YjhB (NUDIX family)